MSEVYEKLVLKRGQDKTYLGTVTDENGDEIDLANTKIWFTVKKDYDNESDDSEAEFQLKNIYAGGDDTQIKILEPTTDGQYEVYIKKAHTQNMTPDLYVFDVQIDHPTYGIQYPTEGSFTLKKEVTRS
jgi:hypothetical protein